ncbi:hypothetical protein ACIRQF_02410 [Streptomyces sp. NPDC101191]|uniref:hypothetical protein n=1 Tax=Streptomyces sp. NPDC101191 TaxID=3366126 RepID=UPI003811A80D
MTALLVLIGTLAALAVVLVVVLLRRGSGVTENADGLVTEQARRERAHLDRSNFSSAAVHSSLPTMTDRHHRP